MKIYMLYFHFVYTYQINNKEFLEVFQKIHLEPQEYLQFECPSYFHHQWFRLSFCVRFVMNKMVRVMYMFFLNLFDHMQI